jgi:hypothetical protein
MQSMETASSAVAAFLKLSFPPFDELVVGTGAVVVPVPDNDVDDDDDDDDDDDGGDELVDGDTDVEGNAVSESPVLVAVGVLDLVELTAVVSDLTLERTGSAVGSGKPILSIA